MMLFAGRGHALNARFKALMTPMRENVVGRRDLT
jgi:hypothetical protein